jgi:ribonucleoside-triphosphate reductase
MEEEQKTCNEKTEVYSRVVGFYRPIEQWNPGKKSEFSDRKEYVLQK